MEDYARMSRRLARLAEARLNLSEAPLQAHLGKAQRHGSLALRRDLETVIEAETLSGHPRLAALIDPVSVRRAAVRAARALKAVDRAADRAAYWRAVAGTLAFNLALGIVSIIGMLVWLGRIGPQAW